MHRGLKIGLVAVSLAMAAAVGPLGAGAQAAGTAGVEATIKGFKGSKGVALVTVYNSDDNWLEADKAIQTIKRPIKGGKVVVSFEGLPPGVYGVSVVHDENKNGKMDMRWFPFPKPKEGAGASRDPKAKMGPPKWDDAKLQIKAGETKKLVINMRYM